MWITIDKENGVCLSRQIYSAIKEQILSGNIEAGRKLLSSRALSRGLCVSRNTVIEAYAQLTAEGYLESRHGSGTIVAKGIKSQKKVPIFKNNADAPAPLNAKEKVIDFRPGTHDFGMFPRGEWAKLYSKICRSLPPKFFRYSSYAGVWQLRENISDYLFRTRGIESNPNNVFITSGATQGLSLVSALLHNIDKTALVEDPIHKNVLNIFSFEGYIIKPIAADDKGINTDLLYACGKAAFIYTTPSHHYPLGGILPIQRRQALIEYCLRNASYIIESDYGSNFYFSDSPISSIYELNPQKVIYVSSFSKVLTPALRLGFIILPDELIPMYEAHKMKADIHTESISQFVLAEFIRSGSFERHSMKIKKEYNKKKKYLISELLENFGDMIKIKHSSAGLHILADFGGVDFTQVLVEKLSRSGVQVYPVEDFMIKPKGVYRNQIILGYAHLNPSDIANGVKIIKDTLK